MNRKQHIFTIIRKHRQELLEMGIAMIGVFGSVARGDDNFSSDYDILVEFDEKHHTFKYFNQLCDFIEKYIGDNYDLVTRQGLSPYLKQSILQEVEYVDISS